MTAVVQGRGLKVHQLYRLLLLALGAGGVLLAYHGFQMRYYGRFGPGPGFFPVWLGCLIGALCVVGLFQDLRAPGDPREPVISTAGGIWRVGGMLVSLAALALLAEILGFRLSILLYMMITPYLLARMTLKAVVPVAIAASFGVAYIFESWLLVRLPGSSIPFLSALGF